jgi:hypothetical protein
MLYIYLFTCRVRTKFFPLSSDSKELIHTHAHTYMYNEYQSIHIHVYVYIYIYIYIYMQISREKQMPF